MVALGLASRTFFSPGFCLGLIKRYCSVEYWNTSPFFQWQMCCFAWKGSEFYNQLHHFFISINNSLFGFVTICKNMSTTNCHRLSDSDWACTVVVRVMAWSDGLWWRKCWHSLCGKKKHLKSCIVFHKADKPNSGIPFWWSGTIPAPGKRKQERSSTCRWVSAFPSTETWALVQERWVFPAVDVWLHSIQQLNRCSGSWDNT